MATNPEGGEIPLVLSKKEREVMSTDKLSEKDRIEEERFLEGLSYGLRMHVLNQLEYLSPGEGRIRAINLLNDVFVNVSEDDFESRANTIHSLCLLPSRFFASLVDEMHCLPTDTRIKAIKLLGKKFMSFETSVKLLDLMDRLPFDLSVQLIDCLHDLFYGPHKDYIRDTDPITAISALYYLPIETRVNVINLLGRKLHPRVSVEILATLGREHSIEERVKTIEQLCNASSDDIERANLVAKLKYGLA